MRTSGFGLAVTGLLLLLAIGAAACGGSSSSFSTAVPESPTLIATTPPLPTATPLPTETPPGMNDLVKTAGWNMTVTGADQYGAVLTLSGGGMIRTIKATQPNSYLLSVTLTVDNTSGSKLPPADFKLHVAVRDAGGNEYPCSAINLFGAYLSCSQNDGNYVVG